MLIRSIALPVGLALVLVGFAMLVAASPLTHALGGVAESSHIVAAGAIMLMSGGLLMSLDQRS